MFAARMIRVLALLLTLTSTLWSQSATTRIAVVRVADIYSGLESTARLDERVRREREEIMSDPRAVDLRRIIGELREMETMTRNSSARTDEQTALRLDRALDIKRQEAWTLQREFENFRSQRDTEINRGMVAEMRQTLNLIAATARRIAREQNFDLLLDSSGGTNTGVPFIVYQKIPVDLTEAVTAAIVREITTPPAD